MNKVLLLLDFGDREHDPTLLDHFKDIIRLYHVKITEFPCLEGDFAENKPELTHINE